MQSSRNVFPLLVVALAGQVLLFAHIELWGRVVAYPYVIALLLLPSQYRVTAGLVVAFLLGLAVDLFASTPGLHAASCTLLAFVRPYLVGNLRARFNHAEDVVPTLRNMGIGWTLQYTLILVGLHHAALFILASTPHPRLDVLLTQIVGSTLLTTAIILLIQLFVHAGHRER